MCIDDDGAAGILMMVLVQLGCFCFTFVWGDLQGVGGGFLAFLFYVAFFVIYQIRVYFFLIRFINMNLFNIKIVLLK